MFGAISQVEGYWQSLSDGGQVPERAAVDPRGMADILEYVFVLEHVATGISRLRVAGSHISTLMGMEVRGMPLTALFSPQSRDKISALVDEVIETPCLVEVSLTSHGSRDQPRIEGKLFLAPLKDENGTVTRLLGCLQTTGRTGRTPRRFDEVQATRRPLNQARPFQPSAGVRQIAWADSARAAIARARPPYLRLVYSAD